MGTIARPSPPSATPSPQHRHREGAGEAHRTEQSSFPVPSLPEGRARYRVDDLPARIAAKIVPDPVTGCWVWTAALGGKGMYGKAWWDGRLAQAHRVTYHFLKDRDVPVFPGSKIGTPVIDHLCHNKRCVNPAHLQLCSNRVNNLRKRKVTTSPLLGVSWRKDRSRWSVQLFDYEAGQQREWSTHRDEVEAGLRAIEVYEAVDPDAAQMAREVLVQYVADIQAWLEAAR